MSHAPFAHIESLRIGTVDFVAPDKLEVLLDIEAPESVALNTGNVHPFPRVNSYALIPVEDGYLVGQIDSITIERSAYPKRKGMQDFGLIDLPYPLRKVRLSPVGTICQQEKSKYTFKRGATTLPSVGAPVLLPTKKQLRSIVRTGKRRRVQIGTSPLAANADVSVDPDRLFGRHLAVLGNTGSGKSCSVAGLIRWSLQAAKENMSNNNATPNARFIVLDPNGEYSRAFSRENTDMKVKVFTVDQKSGECPLRVPLWLWNRDEWISFTQASAKTQQPTMIQALRNARSIRDGDQNSTSDIMSHKLKGYIRTLISSMQVMMRYGVTWGAYGSHPKQTFAATAGAANKIDGWHQVLLDDWQYLNSDAQAKLKDFVDLLGETYTKCSSDKYPNYIIPKPQLEKLLRVAHTTHEAFGGLKSDTEYLDADTPVPFASDLLVHHVESAAETLGVAEHVDTLVMRIKSLLGNNQIKQVIDDDRDDLAQLLADYIGGSGDNKHQLTILDLSFIPAEVIHVVTAVVARVIFESLQYYRKLNEKGKSLPTVLVMEEAHTFIRRYKDDAEIQNMASVCCKVFERIAREGRKYGLGLVLSSQRPSELSPTVLAQCNTFLLHRISNDRDQDLVGKLLPDSLRGLLRDLPLLPSQHAILLGWASELPVLVKMKELPENQQPLSKDPDYWDVWTNHGPEVREVDWKALADYWQGNIRQSTGAGAEGASNVNESNADAIDDPNDI